MLVFLLLGARYLELAARQRAARSLDRLYRWTPSPAVAWRRAATGAGAVLELAHGDAASSCPPAIAFPRTAIVEEGATQRR